MSLKNWTMEFGKNRSSKSKNLLNAIVTSKQSYTPQDVSNRYTFNNYSYIYAFWILVVSVFSISMLVVDNAYIAENRVWITTVETFTFTTLLIDYIIRWYTADVRLKRGNWSFILYPFSFSGIILLVSLLPSFYLLNVWFDINIFTELKSMKFLRIFRIILLANIVPGVAMFRRVIKKEATILYTVFSLVVVVTVLFAVVIFNVEGSIDKNGHKSGDANFDPSSVQFKNYLDALYYSTITLTTVGFGDKTPHTDFGKAITIVMSIVGIAVLTIPSGVIAGGFISEIRVAQKLKEQKTIELDIRKLKREQTRVHGEIAAASLKQNLKKKTNIKNKK